MRPGRHGCRECRRRHTISRLSRPLQLVECTIGLSLLRLLLPPSGLLLVWQRARTRVQLILAVPRLAATRPWPLLLLLLLLLAPSLPGEHVLLPLRIQVLLIHSPALLLPRHLCQRLPLLLERDCPRGRLSGCRAQLALAGTCLAGSHPGK